MVDIKKLAKLMNEQGINNRMLANAIGVSEAFAHYIVEGKKQPSLVVYTELCNYLGVSLDELATK